MPIHGYPGNVITANPTAPTVSSASGVWTTEQQLLAVSQGNWPGYEYPISRSLRFNSADSAYLNRTPASASNRKTFTWSGWVKRGALSSSASYFLFAAGSFAGSTNTSIRVLNDSINIYWGGTGGPQWTATAVLRDPSAWYHLVFAFDTTQATFGNRLKLYVNGVQSTVWSLQESTGLTAQNSDLYINNNQQHNLGASGTPGNYFDGYMTEINFIDGQALTPSSFGETDSNTGVWKPKAFSGTYGTNGFYLKFADNSGTTSTTLGKDSSGNGNNWTPNNFSVTAGAGNDSLVDSPTAYGTDTGVGGEVRGNYATLNPFQLATSGALFTLANGNLDYSCSASTGNAGRMYCEATMALHSGKSYWEIQVTNTNPYIGVISEGTLLNGGTPNGNTGVVAVYSSGQAVTGTSTATYSGTTFTFTTNDIIGFAWDGTALTLGCYKNGSLIGTWSNFESTKTWFPVIGISSSSSSTSAIANFGQRAFAYTAPSGFKALCTQNLPTPTIGATSTTQADDYFDAVLWSGDSSLSRNITGWDFNLDFLWVKQRNAVRDNWLVDRVRGVQKGVVSNTTTAEATDATATNAFVDGSGANASGFTAGNGSAVWAGVNGNGNTYVGWGWKANGAGSTNTAGTITSTVSASTTSGFSIVTYTGNGTGGATVGHGLGVSPSWIIIKSRSNATNWMVWTDKLTTNYALEGLNTTGAEVSGGSPSKYIRAVSSTTFTIGNDISVNQSASYTYVAYCFAPVAGYSAFGSYTGNGSTDGPFVFTNFRPRYLLVKASSTAGYNWVLFDSARSPTNVASAELYPNLSNAEGTDNSFDFLSNGFKLRVTSGNKNLNGTTYIYAAFAETPFRYSLAR